MTGQSRDTLLLLELVEHLEYAYEDVAQFNSAEELALSRRDRNSAAKEIEQAPVSPVFSVPLKVTPFTTRPSHGERSLTNHGLKAQ